MNIPAFLADSVELVEEKHAAPGVGEFKEASEPCGCLSEVAGDESVVANDDQRDHERMRQSFGERRLSVSRWADQQEAIAGAEVVGAENVRSVMFLHEFFDRPSQRGPHHDIGESFLRGDLVDEIDSDRWT